MMVVLSVDESVFVIPLTVMFWNISLAVAIGREYIGSTTLKSNSNMMVVLSVDESVFVIPLTEFEGRKGKGTL